MNGILCIDKPDGFTSFDVVAKMRRILKTKKIGHAGTLDPMATGVLPLFIGRAAKAADIMPDNDKRYTAVFKLGITTDTQDITGDILSQNTVSVIADDVAAALTGFIGPQKQLPPMYSAVRVNGQRLYDLARKGIVAEREPRDINVYDIILLDKDEAGNTYTIDVACSKGTYIRTLCHDLGQKLGCGAVLTALRRTEACGFTLDTCITLGEAQKLADSGALSEMIMPADTLFTSFSKLRLGEKQTRMFKSGVRLSLERLGLGNIHDCAAFTVYGPDGAFIAVARADTATDSLISRKWFGET